MTTKQGQSDAVAEALAERVIEDIYDRGLVVGDRYLTGDEACNTFHVGKSLLNNAFKLLADRQYLIRKRKAGTYIGPQFPAGAARGKRSASALSVVHVLMPMDYYRAKPIPGSVFVDQLADEIPGVSVQIHHIADHDVHDYTVDLVERLGAQPGNSQGLILIRSPRESQRVVQDSGLPAVVFGSTYPGIRRLCSIDIDQAQAGQLAAKFALSAGHENFALIMRNHWRHGDNLLMEGFARQLGEAGVGLDSLSIVSAPEDPQIIEHEVAALLAQDPHPTALVCRSAYHARAAGLGVRDIGLTPGQDVAVIAVAPGPIPEVDRAVTIESKLTSAEQVGMVARALVAMVSGQDADAFTRRIEMRIVDHGGDGGEASGGRRVSSP
ncbi:MAG: substrate-binding domain-containing protein [Phycisphaeraceae bacterium]